MAAGTRFQPSDRLFVAAALIALVVFFTTRGFLQLGTIPFLVYDSHKYLGAADSLFAGSGWTPLYASGKAGDVWLSVVGGILHVTPGYPWAIVALWSSFGAITVRGIVIAQSVAALFAFAGFSFALGRRQGRWWGLAAFLPKI